AGARRRPPARLRPALRRALRRSGALRAWARCGTIPRRPSGIESSVLLGFEPVGAEIHAFSPEATPPLLRVTAPPCSTRDAPRTSPRGSRASWGDGRSRGRGVGSTRAAVDEVCSRDMLDLWYIDLWYIDLRYTDLRYI